MLSASPDGSSRTFDLGRYRLIAELARGGMGVVYLALVRGPGGFHKLLVVKELMRHLADDEQLLAMFIDEGRLAARLSHPNVVQTIEVGNDAGRYFMVMEYLDGQTLHRLIGRARQRGQALPLTMMVRIVADVLAGLHYAHELTDFDGTPLDVVHRDVSPQNVFVTYDGQVKVVDFGIAKALDSSTRTTTGVLKGKVPYLAPEQAQGEKIDRRADVFATGAILYQILAGKRLWDGMNDMQILNWLMHDRVPRLAEAHVDAPAALVEIVDRALAPSPGDRFPTAAAMERALDEWLASAHATGAHARELGKVVSELFDEDRAKLRTLIDTQVKAARSEGSSDPRLELATVPGAASAAFATETSEPRAAPTRVDVPATPAPIAPLASLAPLAEQETTSPTRKPFAAPPRSSSTSRAAPFLVIVAAVLVGSALTVTALSLRGRARETTPASEPRGIAGALGSAKAGEDEADDRPAKSARTKSDASPVAPVASSAAPSASASASAEPAASTPRAETAPTIAKPATVRAQPKVEPTTKPATPKADIDRSNPFD